MKEQALSTFEAIQLAKVNHITIYYSFTIVYVYKRPMVTISTILAPSITLSQQQVSLASDWV